MFAVPDITCKTCAYWNGTPEDREEKGVALCLHLSRFDRGENSAVLTGGDYLCKSHIPEPNPGIWETLWRI